MGFPKSFVAAPAVIVQRQLASRPRAAGGGGGGNRVGGGGATVDMVGLAFNPRAVTVAKGSTLLFTNSDVAPHTVTSDSGTIDSGTIPPGGSFSLVATAGFPYHCTIHPSMTAKVVVST